MSQKSQKLLPQVRIFSRNFDFSKQKILGESTPTRRFRRQQEQQLLLLQQKQLNVSLPPNNYQLLAKHIERQAIHPPEQKREFEEKFELAEVALKGPRLKIRQKSQAAILQSLLKLEEEVTTACEGVDKKKRRMGPVPKGKHIAEDL